MEPVLLDTSVWIDALRGKRAAVVAMTRGLLHDDRVVTCGPVLFEIKRGLRFQDRRKILPLFDALIRLSVDETVWDAAGDLDASLRKKGVTVPPMDIIIAQVCIHHRVFLYTLDEHFRVIPGLKIFKPDTPARPNRLNRPNRPNRPNEPNRPNKLKHHTGD